MMWRHPLADFVLGLYEQSDEEYFALDSFKLAHHLTGGPLPDKTTCPTEAYLTVATDVLHCMERSGELVRDRHHWCVLPKQEEMRRAKSKTVEVVASGDADELLASERQDDAARRKVADELTQDAEDLDIGY